MNMMKQKSVKISEYLQYSDICNRKNLWIGKHWNVFTLLHDKKVALQTGVNNWLRVEVDSIWIILTPYGMNKFKK